MRHTSFARLRRYSNIPTCSDLRLTDAKLPAPCPLISPSRPLLRWQKPWLSSIRFSVSRVTVRSFRILAIETSCDDTCVAVLDFPPRSSGLRSVHQIFHGRVTSDNSKYGGVHPLRSLESHQEQLATMVNEAKKAMASAAPDQPSQPDLIAVTRGPGMRNNLKTGIDVAKGLSVAWDVPLIGVHHMQAHALSFRYENHLSQRSEMNLQKVTPDFPFLSLLVSGGHTLLVESTDVTKHSIVASTSDIAIGDCLDKIGRLVLPPKLIAEAKSVAYGALLEPFAFGNVSQKWHAEYSPPANATEELSASRTKNEYGWQIPTPLLTADGKKGESLEFSFSGIVAATERAVTYGSTHGTPRDRPIDEGERKVLAAAAMKSAFEHVANRLSIFLNKSGVEACCIVLGGGVARNHYLQTILTKYIRARTSLKDFQVQVPSSDLCIDNATMIAWTAAEMLDVVNQPQDVAIKSHLFKDSLKMGAIRKWSLANLLSPEKELERERLEEIARDERQALRKRPS